MTGRVRRAARRAAATGAGLAIAALSLAACGSQPAAGEAEPELRQVLATVDTAVAGERYQAARRALRVLTDRTLEARRSGVLAPEQADRILAAAARLEHELPAPAPRPEPSLSSPDEEDEEKSEEKSEEESGEEKGHEDDEGREHEEEGEDD